MLDATTRSQRAPIHTENAEERRWGVLGRKVCVYRGGASPLDPTCTRLFGLRHLRKKKISITVDQRCVSGRRTPGDLGTATSQSCRLERGGE